MTCICKRPFGPRKCPSGLGKRRSGLALAAGLALVLILASSRAEARRAGIASEGCSGCHSGGATPTVTITSSSAMIATAQMVTFSVNITTPEGYAGLFLTADVGTLASLAGQGTQLVSGGITHTAPKKAVNGVTTFQVGWTAPAAPGGVNLNAYVVAANNDGGSRGDGPGEGFEAFAFGCAGTMYYRDFDGDGFGAETSGYTRSCGLPKYYAAVLGDCDDNDERIYPGAAEVCNKRDDNCNGMIDEGLPIVTYHVDADGDGHGVAAGPTVMGCAPPKGYGVGTDDCDDANPNVYPGAPELCDYIDNNCNGQVDENARSSCGVGWCRRLGESCSSTSCTPGQPRPETCNDFDDDCDGVPDNGTDLELCGATGLTCVAGACVKPGTVPIPVSGPDAGVAASGGTSSSNLTGAGGEGVPPSREQGGCALAGVGPVAPAQFAVVLALPGLAFFLVRARRRRR
ncbi:MAG TPA: MopE-related protein [Polyangia bacterium]